MIDGRNRPRACEIAGVEPRCLHDARAVLRHSPEFARLVIAGGMSLDEALLKVRQAEGKVNEVKEAIQSDEERDLCRLCRAGLAPSWGRLTPRSR